MINHVTSLAGTDSQSFHEMGPLQNSSSEEREPKPDENILNPLKVMSHDIRSLLLSMLATLKLLNRGYYGKMDEEVAYQIKDLLSSATRLTGMTEACLGRTLAGDEEVKVAAPNRVMESCERSTPNKQSSTGTKGEIQDGYKG